VAVLARPTTGRRTGVAPFGIGRRLRSGVLDERLRALRSIPELASLNGRALACLVSYVDEVEVGAGSRIATEGRPCEQFVIVERGCLRADSPGGRRRNLGPGDSWGWTQMWERSLSDRTVVTETPARLLVMGHAQFRAVKALREFRR
jgi:CRP-like cAMP-binding protein